MQIRLVSFALFFLITCNLNAAEGIETQPWPTEPDSGKFTIQFLELEFRLPYSMIKGVALLQGDPPQLLLTTSEGPPTDYIAVQTLYGFNTEIYPSLERQGLFEATGINNTESFFDSLALPVTTKDQAVLRAVLGTEKSLEYYKASKGPFTAYRNITDQANLQSIILLLDGTDTVYEISGSISDKDYEYLLSGLRSSHNKGSSD
jgi:hypothetical protein